mmetsp:Transcript_21779/g.33846  ORF Transcript_21779/g.33846 Transcript_21779/m.33846 type:complete len:213 (-) Transcript_21779:45-683(-)
MSTTALFCVDAESHLARLDYESLSQQTLMEMVIDQIVRKDLICGSADTPKDISEWNYVSLNEHGEVVEIDSTGQPWEGEFGFEWVPATATRIRLVQKCLSGTVAFDKLPCRLEELILSGNLFSGSADFTQLPDGMRIIGLSRNFFSGSIDLTQLPKTLTQLYLSYNNFSGETDFSQLPESLVMLYVESNFALSGRIRSRPGLDFCTRRTCVR